MVEAGSSLAGLLWLANLDVLFRYLDHRSAWLLNVVNIALFRRVTFAPDNSDVVPGAFGERQLSSDWAFSLFLLEVAIKHRSAVLEIHKRIHRHQPHYNRDCRSDNDRSDAPPRKQRPVVGDILF